MKVLLITGGNSSERKISLISAGEVKKALIQNGHKVKVYDLRGGYEPIIKLSKDSDILFPILHGEEGEGGKLHEFLSKLEKLIVGTRNYKSLEEAWYKIPFKKFLDKNKIKTSKWKIVKTKEDVVKFGFPSVLKASNGGSSREVMILKSKNDLKSKNFNRLINSKTPLLVEQFIKGTEVTIGILNGVALPILEIVPVIDSWFSYKTKYDSTTKEIPDAPSVSKKLQEEMKQTTLEVHNSFDLGTYSRTDFIVSGNNYYALEINTIPGLTPGSLMPKQAKAAGMSFNEFIETLVNGAK